MAYTNRLGTLIKADTVGITLTQNDLKGMIEALAVTLVSTRGVVGAELTYDDESDVMGLKYIYVTPTAETIMKNRGMDEDEYTNVDKVLPLLFNTDTVSYKCSEHGAFIHIEMGFDTYMKLALNIEG